jgi:hypothetical protein
MKRRFAVLLAILTVACSALHAAVPPMISYQGKLMQPTGVPVPDGIYSIRFAIYEAPTGGTPLWSEVNPSVQVKGGLFATMLGSVVNLPANIFDGASRFFGVKVGTDLEMTPRQQVASVAFAVKAASADTAATATTVQDGAITTSKIADTAVTSGKLADGSVTITKISDGAVTGSKIGAGVVDRTRMAAFNGIVWKVPAYMGQNPGTDWKPGVNAVWDITQVLHDAGVPDDAQMLLVGISAPYVSNICAFDCQDAAGQVLATIRLSADIPQQQYAPIYPLFSTPVAIPGATRKLNYTATGAYTASYTDKNRSLVVYGWR